jgi:cytochrome c oxidase subunit 2
VAAASTPPPSGDRTRHGLRVVVAWLILSAVATPLVVLLLGPLVPPGNGSGQASGQVFDNQGLLLVVTPLVCLLVVFFLYTLVVFRAGGELRDGPPIRANPGVQFTWVLTTTLAVLGLAAFGSYEVLRDGSGGGQGPSPIALPGGPKLPVQVIAQQWEFTYRYPTYGGVETPHLVLPADRAVELHVTSLDAVHSFWAYELGVKADANPGVDNVAYVVTKGPMSFHIHCAELCGLWHGYMFDTGQVVGDGQFASWIRQQEATFEPVSRYLPPYAPTYSPDPQRRAG